MAVTASPTAEPNPAATPPHSPPPRRRVAGRVSFGHVVMVAAALLAFVLVMGVLQDRQATVAVAVAAHDISPGARIGDGDVRAVTVAADSPLLRSLVRAEALDTGARAARRIANGDVLNRADITASGAAPPSRSMSIPVSAEHAVGGQLAPGEWVDVIDGSTQPAEYVLLGAEVLAVASRSGTRGLAQVRDDYFVTVTVDESSALRLAQAIASGKLELVRSSARAKAER